MSKEHLPVAIERAQRLATQAANVVDVETCYAMDVSRHERNAEKVKRDLLDATADYLTYHWDGYVPWNASPAVLRLSLALHPDPGPYVKQSQERAASNHVVAYRTPMVVG